MGSQLRRLAILSFVVSMLAIGLESAVAEECDYKTCGALMARDALATWAVSGRHDYSPDTKRACAEFNAWCAAPKTELIDKSPFTGSFRSLLSVKAATLLSSR